METKGMKNIDNAVKNEEKILLRHKEEEEVEVHALATKLYI